MIVQAMTSDHHAFGFDLAANAVRMRAAAIGGFPAISIIGTLPVVFDFGQITKSFARAA